MTDRCDVFLSYSHNDQVAADHVRGQMATAKLSRPSPTMAIAVILDNLRILEA